MTPFDIDRLYDFLWRSIVTTALSGVVSGI